MGVGDGCVLLPLLIPPLLIVPLQKYLKIGNPPKNPAFGTADTQKYSKLYSIDTVVSKKIKKKKVRESRGFQNLSKSLIFSVQSCERGFSGPKIAVKFLESEILEGQKSYHPFRHY